MVLRLLRSEPALAPLFAAVGLGVVGSVAFATHYLAHSPDVIIKKNSNPEPWNRVDQHQNTKMFTWNKEAWQHRMGMPHPQASFLSDGTPLTGDSVDKALDIRRQRNEQAAREKDQKILPN